MGASLIISLEGLPGAGKTTSAELLGEIEGITCLHERSADVPFLDAFYSNVERYKLETELCFVLVHYHQYRDIDEQTILDYSPTKDLVFADLNLEGADYQLFRNVYSYTLGRQRLPDVAVFLDLDHDLLLERIAQRDRAYERKLDPAYLARLGDAYERRFDELGEAVVRVPVTASDSPEEVAWAAKAAIGEVCH